MNPLAIECPLPHCKASRGKMCRELGAVRTAHEQRVLAARQKIVQTFGDRFEQAKIK